MKTILFILFIALSVSMMGQDVQEIVRAEIVTGASTGDGEIKAAFRRFNIVDSLIHRWINRAKGIYNWQDSSIVIINHIYFNLEKGATLEEGEMAWDSIDKTLSVGLDAGSSGQMFQEIHMRSTNKTGDTIFDGRIVYVDGAQGSRPTIALASDTSISAILTLGPATQNIINNRTGYVTLVGLVRGYDTRGFIPGVPLWLGTEPGSLTNIRPPAPRTAVTLGVALNATEDGIIATRPVVVQRLAWLSDVDARDEQEDWDFLYWRSDSLKWDLSDGRIHLDSIVFIPHDTAIPGPGLMYLDTDGNLYLRDQTNTTWLQLN